MSFRKTISWVLFPLTMWYAIGVALRNFCFSIGLLRQEAPRITTIGVGNLCTGGAGKTPHVEYLLRLLSKDYPTALLSRGYHRKTKGFLLAKRDILDAAHLGDEPAMLARKFPHILTAVCERRLEGVKRLMALKRPPALIIMDDVYQHRYIKPTLNILLTEYQKPYCNDHILPFGDLREFRSARSRANIVIVTKSPTQLNPIEKHAIIQSLGVQNYQKVFFSYYNYGDLRSLSGAAGPQLSSLDHILLITGIAHPDPMVEYLQQYCPVTHLAYPDHHDFTPAEVAAWQQQLAQLPGEHKCIITTEKDAARLDVLKPCPETDGTDNSQLSALNSQLYILPIEVCFHKSHDHDFNQLVRSIVQENISFLDCRTKTEERRNNEDD